MAKLKAVYDNLDEIPEAHRELYEQNASGKFVASIEGALLADDHKSLITALDSEREARSKAERELKRFADVDLVSIDEWKKRIPELEEALREANESKRTSIEKAVEERLGPLRREHENQVKALTAQSEQFASENQSLKSEMTTRQFEDALRKECVGKGVQDLAIDDVINRAQRFGWSIDQNGDFTTARPDGTRKYSPRNPTNPIAMDEWFDAVLVKEAPHVFKVSQSGGAAGSRGSFPTLKQRSKMTESEKIEYVDTHGFGKYQELPD